MISRINVDRNSPHRNGHLVVPCGGQLESGAATRFGFQLADRLCARLTLVHVRPQVDAGDGFEGIGAFSRLHRVLRMPPDSSRFTPSFAGRFDLDDRKELPADRQLVGQNGHLRFVYRSGDLVSRLVEVHEADPVDLFIVQPQKRPWYSWFLHTELGVEIRAATDCPVVVVPKSWKPEPSCLEPAAKEVS